MTRRPRADVEPIVARSDETSDLPPVAGTPQATVQGFVWSADGSRLQTDLAATLEAADATTAPASPWIGHERTLFEVAPGHHVARVDRAGKPPVEQPIDVPAARRSAARRSIGQITRRRAATRR